MKKFIVIYYAPMDGMKPMAGMSKEDQARGMETWMVWAKNYGDKLVDLGAPLMNGKALHPGGISTESQKEVTSYSVLQAKDIAEAVSLLQGHPHLGWNATYSIEVYETIPLHGM